MAHICQRLRGEGKRIGFVPTMGFLHAGHLSLIERARKENDVVIVSIFVNPAQFGPHEDFSTYPRDIEHDRSMIRHMTDYLFCPPVDEIYFPTEHFDFYINDLADSLCGVSRPHHFAGVVLVLSKFFHIVQPHAAYFGQKDYQQYLIIKTLVQEFFLQLQVILCPTIREKDGLAMSSRNVFLNKEERHQAPFLYQSLLLAEKMLKNGEKNVATLLKNMKEFLRKCPLARLDYIDIRNAHTLQKIETIGDPVVVALAAYFGKTRLIDNILFSAPHYEIKR